MVYRYIAKHVQEQVRRSRRTLFLIRLMKCLKQIAGLRQAITSGKLGPGDMVGTEFAFSQQWGLARNTVRRGVDTLISEGLLERRPGKGLFVRAPHTTTRTVQVVVPNLAWSHVLRIARGAQQMGAQ